MSRRRRADLHEWTPLNLPGYPSPPPCSTAAEDYENLEPLECSAELPAASAEDLEGKVTQLLWETVVGAAFRNQTEGAFPEAYYCDESPGYKRINITDVSGCLTEVGPRGSRGRRGRRGGCRRGRPAAGCKRRRGAHVKHLPPARLLLPGGRRGRDGGARRGGVGVRPASTHPPHR